MSAREAQRRLGRGERMLRIYAKRGQLRSRLQGRRLEYYRPDVETLAATLPEDDRNRVPDQQVMPAGELLSHIRELERQLAETMAQAGYLRGQLETQQLQLTDAKAAQRQLADKERQAADLQYKLDEMTGKNRRQRTLIVLLGLVAVVAIIILVLMLAGVFTR
jgi:hypothetical protein